VHELLPQTTLVDRYVLRQRLGGSGGSSVWQAEDLVLDRTVAVRLLDATAAANPDADANADPSVGSRGLTEAFEREARAAARMAHPNIVSVYDVGVHEGVPFAVIEFVDGVTLGALVERDGPLDPGRAASLAGQVLAAFIAARTKGVHHGPIGPEDVFIRGDLAKVGGFGDLPIDGAKDGDDTRIAAALLYLMLTGVPWTGEEAPTPRGRSARVPRDLDQLVTRALAGEFATSLDLSAALARITMAPSPVGMGADAAPLLNEEDLGSSRSSLFRSWMLVPLLLLIVTVVVIVGGLAIGRLQLGGPLGVEAAPLSAATPVLEPSAPQALRPEPIAIAEVTAFDPDGDQHESDDDAGASIDGTRATAWQTEYYDEGVLAKPGVGLLFTLENRATIQHFRLATPLPGTGFQIQVGDDVEEMTDELRRDRGTKFIAQTKMREDLKPASGKYIIVWFTSLVEAPDGKYRAALSEFEVAGNA